MKIDLDRIGQREFDQLARVTLQAEFGIKFQDSIDSDTSVGRASFFGIQESAPENPLSWKGKGNVKVHFRSRLDIKDNYRWLRSQVAEDLRALRRKSDWHDQLQLVPQFLVIVTNVRLDTASTADLQDEMASQAHFLGIEGSLLLPSDDFAQMISRHDTIAKQFIGLVSGGEPFTVAQSFVAPEAIDVIRKVRHNSAKEIRTKDWIRLSDTGLIDDQKLALSSIGIDLPALVASHRGHPDNSMAAAEILRQGNSVLRRSVRGKDSSAIVLVGGPGQGKSTVGQIICQAYRVALLERDDRFPVLSESIDRITSSFDRMKIELPRNLRWPIKVELSRFGDENTASHPISLLGHIASELSKVGEAISEEELRCWLTAWPWAVFLDGFDEVASTSSRTRAVDGLDDFLLEVDNLDADVLILATTRPQGYHDELRELKPTVITLKVIENQEALAYGRRVIRARHGDDRDRANLIEARLTTALTSDSPAAHLMKSPLQVTVMTTLLERLIHPPSTRYALFDEYYKTIYAREVSKAGELGEALQTYKKDVTWLHEQVAIRLQVRSERGGSAESLMSKTEFEQLLANRLRRAGHSDSEVARLTGELTQAARDRLVLLVAYPSATVGFELRSFQEYMAGRAIATGADQVVMGRLEQLVTSAYWRNTWLFAAGRAFDLNEDSADLVLERLRQIDLDSVASQFVAPGERIALDLIDDEFAASLPRLRRSLLKYSLGGLTRWPGLDTSRLAGAVASGLEDVDTVTNQIVRSAIRDGLASNGPSRVAVVFVLRYIRGKGPIGAETTRAAVLAQAYLAAEDLADFASSADVSPQQTQNLLKTLSSGFAPEVHRLLSASKIRRKIGRVLTEDVFASDLRRAEALANSPVSLNQAKNYLALFEEPDVLSGVLLAASSLGKDDATAAIFMRQVISILSERLGATKDEDRFYDILSARV